MLMMRSRWARRLLGARTVVAVVIGLPLLEGCSTGPVGAAPAVTASPTAEQEARWATPVDDFVLTSNELDVVGLAEDLLISDCMAGKGFVWKPVMFSESEQSSEVVSATGLHLFNEKLAAAHGYTTMSRYPASVDAATSAAMKVKMSDAEAAADDACSQPALDQMGSQAASDQSTTFSSIASSAWEGAKTQPAVVAAAAAWRTCMAPLGISDLPGSPNESDNPMPTTSMSRSWGEASAQDTSAKEIAQALADARCRTSSGYTHQFYLADWNAVEATLAAHPSLLDQGHRARESYNAMLTKARTIIAAHAGS